MCPEGEVAVWIVSSVFCLDVGRGSWSHKASRFELRKAENLCLLCLPAVSFIDIWESVVGNDEYSGRNPDT